ncbi:MAG: tetratricopeptide repeat protein, partial [Pseudomonadota bacterium]
MRYRFNQYLLDVDTLELSHAGAPLHAEPQVIALLALLIANHERTVTKQEILEKIWSGRVVSEAALSSRVKMLRQLLGDDGRKQQYIRTVHKRGFRWASDVQTETPDPSLSIDRATDLRSKNRSDPGVESRSIDGVMKQPEHVQDNNPAVVVLPFSNLSSEPGQDYLSDGLTTDITGHLAKHRWIDVVARNTAFGYRDKAVDVSKIGKDLGVSYVVEGSVQRAVNRVRITVNLIHSETRHSVWTERFDREIEDIFALQDEITEMIAARLEPEIGYAERNRVVQSRPNDLRSWDRFHLGVYHFYKFTAKDNREAQRLLRESYEIDPHFADAHVWWAYSLVLGMVYWDTAPTPELLDAALNACDKAIVQDRRNATFHALRARVLLARGEYDLAIAENNKAIQLNPTLAVAHCALGDSLAYEGRYEEAIKCFEKSIALSPNDPQLWAFYTYGALALIFKHDYEKALAWVDLARSIPNYQYWTNAHRIVALSYLGRVQDTRKVIESLYQDVPGFSLSFVREKFFFLKDQQQVEHYLQG